MNQDMNQDRDDIWYHATSYNLRSRNHISQDVQDVVRNVDLGPHVHSEWEPEMDTIEIYVEHLYTKNRELFIWIQLDHRNLDFRGYTSTGWKMP